MKKFSEFVLAYHPMIDWFQENQFYVYYIYKIFALFNFYVNVVSRTFFKFQKSVVITKSNNYERT